MHILKKSILLITTALFGASSFALPAQIIVFPHAEKAKNSPHLSSQGITDARILQNFIMTSPQYKPDAVIANRTPHQRAPF